MSATLFKKVDYTVAKLIEDIEMGEIGLPDIQRPFVWSNSKVRDLFDSMYRGFPVGYLLFWANGLPGGHKQIGADTKQKVPDLLIVDGQQRLTSLYAVLKGREIVREDYSQGRLQIAFCPRTETFEVTDAAIRKDPEFIADISEIWAEHIGFTKFLKGFMGRLTEAREVSAEEEVTLEERIDQVRDLKSYPLTALELSSGVGEEQVAEVFVRINSQGVTLNQADFILTLMSVFWDQGRTELEEFCRQARHAAPGQVSPRNHYIEPDPDQLLRVSVALGFRRARLQHVYSLLRGKDLETGEFSDEQRIGQFETLKAAQSYVVDLQHWHDFFKVLMRAGFRQGWMISSKLGMLYTYALYLIGKRDYAVPEHELRDVMARWFFMTALTGRYTTSPESVMEEDLARLREVNDAQGFVDRLDGIVSTTLHDDFWRITVPTELETSSARSPVQFAYYAALNLLDAQVLFSKLKVAELLEPTGKAPRAATEKHHLFAKGYLNSLGVTTSREHNQVANYALVEWQDNASLSDTPPSQYFPEYCGRFGEDELRQMCYWHALPEGWHEMAYDEFLIARRRAMAQVTRDGFQRLCE